MWIFHKLVSKHNRISGKIWVLLVSFVIILPISAMEGEEEKVQTFHMKNVLERGQREGGTERKKIRVLVIEGGGVRGIIPATILEKMEEELRAECGKEARIAHCFNLMAGTSTGGIIVLGLNALDPKKPHLNKASKLSKLYLEQGDKIFPELGKFKKIQSVIRPKYDASPLEKVLEENLGNNVWLSDSCSHVLIPADDMGQQTAYVFDSLQAKKFKSENFLMKDIGRATSAAPTYFEAAKIKDKKGYSHTYTDGGTYANDPTFEAVAKARKLFPEQDLFIVSLGTGETPRRFGDLSLQSGGLKDWAPEIAPHLMRRAQDRHLQYIEHLSEEMTKNGQQVDYYRVQLTIDSSISAMDKAANIGKLREAGLYITNSINRGEYKDYQSIIEELKQSYKEKKLNLL